jgi:glycerol kinase
MLFNIHTLEWDAKMLEILDIPREMLPKCALVGNLRPHQERHRHRRYRRRPASGAVRPDVRGSRPGQEHLRHRLLPADEHRRQGGEVQHGMLTTIACGPRGEVAYALEGAVFNGGSTVQWLRDELKIINDAHDTEYFASKVKDSNGVYLVPAFTGLGAPYWDPYARGALFGLTRGVRVDHIIRAALESIAYQTRDVLDAMQQDAGERLKALRVDGGAVANNFLMQFQADILGTQVERPQMRETTALGAAYLAGLACGFWGSLEELRGKAVIERKFEPAAGRSGEGETLRRLAKGREPHPRLGAARRR